MTPVVDYLLTRPDVDPKRIAITGVSQAGYWVPRAVAFEHRIAAAVADPGVVDVSTSWVSQLPPNMRRLLARDESEKFDRDMEFAEKVSKGLRPLLDFRSRPYGTGTPFEAFRAVQEYMLGGVVGQITCPMLICDPENEQFWPGQSQRLYDALESPKTIVRFTAAEGADGHCEPKSAVVRDQRVFDWLDATFAAIK